MAELNSAHAGIISILNVSLCWFRADFGVSFTMYASIKERRERKAQVNVQGFRKECCI